MANIQHVTEIQILVAEFAINKKYRIYGTTWQGILTNDVLIFCSNIIT